MSKPASGTALDTGNALYTSLTAAWAMLEGTGTTTADSKGGGGTATFAGTTAPSWTVDGAGDAQITFPATGSASAHLTVASSTTYAGTASWTVSFRGHGAGMALGDNSGANHFFWLKPGTGLQCRLGPSADYLFTGTTVFTADHDYVVSFDHAALRLHLWVDGVEDSSSPLTTTGTAVEQEFFIDALGNADGNSFVLTGPLSYVYSWTARALTGAEAATLHSGPYSIFLAGGSATITEQNLPSNHAGNITVHAVGTSTTWSSSTTWTPSGVAGWTVASKTFVDTTHYTIVLTGPTAATPPAGATGTLTLTEGVTGSTAATTTIGTPTLTVSSPSSAAPSTTPTLTLAGANTLWASETAAGLFTITAGNTGSSSLATPTVTTNTAATDVLTSGTTVTTLTLKDTSTGATTSFSVANTPIVYDLTDAAIGGVYVQVEGNVTKGTFFAATAWGAVSVDGAVRFKGTIGTLEALVYQDGGPVRLSIDGVDQGSTTTLPNTSSYGYVTISSSLDSTAEHTYLLSFGQVMHIQKLRTTNGTGINTSRLPVRPVLAGYGDSITAGDNYGTPVDSTASWLHLAALSLNYQAVNLGSHSATVVANGQTGTAQITGLLPPASVIVVLYGTNDVGVSSQATFGAAYLNMLQLLQAGDPAIPIVCERLLKTTGGDTSRDAFSGEISTRVSSLANTKIVYKQGMYGAYAGGDGVHPAPAEQPAIAAALVAEINSVLAGGGTGAACGRIFTGM